MTTKFVPLRTVLIPLLLLATSIYAAKVVPYLLFANTVDIRRINLDATNYRYVVRGLRNVVGIDFDLNKNEVYWSDVTLKKIQKQPINGGTITDIITDKLGTPEGLALDWKARKLYWTDTGQNTIDTSDLDGKNRKTLVSVGLDQPRAIVLDPTNNWMYWTDWGVIAKIEKARMSDASQRQTIVRSGLRWPNALAIDFVDNKLFWADAYYRVVEKSDLFGKGRKTLINQVNVYSPYHMTQYLNRIYWTDWRQRTIEHGDKNTGLDRVSIAGSMTRPTAIHVVHTDRQPSGSNECLQLNGGCAQNCVNTIATYYCTCRTGYSLASDKHACIDNNECSTNHGGCSQICTNTPGSFKCSCLNGYKLAADGLTCTDTDECTVNNGGCSFKCTNTPSSHYCSCRSGYELKSDKKSCQDKNECSSSATNDCPSDASCRNLAGSYLCVCAAGKHYDSVTKKCKDYDECKTSDNKCQQKCSNTDGSYTCSCLVGYQLNADKLSCSDIDDCAQNNGRCQHSCLNTVGSFSCSCKKGYQLNSNKKSCSLVNCGSPAHITGFATTCDGTSQPYQYGKKCTLTCKVGTLFGDSVIECLDSSRWTAPNSGCRGASVVPNRSPTDITLGTKSVPENSVKGTIVGPLQTTDRDLGQTHTYSLTDDASGVFKLDAKTNTITVNKALDYETQSSYGITVKSTDNGTPSMSFTKKLTITISDVNEAPQAPKISKSSVNENSPKQTVVGTLSAVDVDKPAQTLTFTLLSTDRDHFVLGGKSKNELLVNQNTLDYEATLKKHQVTVQVADSGSPPLTSTAVITIVLINQNDPPTAISLSGMSVNEYAQGSSRGANSGDVIGKLTTTDQDASDTHTYGMDDSSNGKVKISGSNVVVDDASKIDYEAAATFKITIKTTDKAGATFTQSFVITVKNVNEAPTDVRISSSDVLEGSPVDTVVGTLTASDRDRGDTHSFTFVSNPGSFFKLSSSTLKVNSDTLDHEKASSVTIEVKATDQGGLSKTKTIVITVNDRNEAPSNVNLTPAVGKACLSTSSPSQTAGDACVPENVPVGELVGTLSAIDVDGNSVTYSLIDSSGFFNLSGADVLVSRSGLDYESTTIGTIVSLSVEATDSFGLVTVKNLHIEILNQNDPPVNISLSVRVVRESTPVRTGFATFSAQDQDGDKLSYILNDDDNGRFGLSGSQLIVMKPLNHETAVKHTISVSCSDKFVTVGPKTFVIEVKDDNDSPINITMNATSIAENQPVGAVVASVIATDEDPNETLTFGLDDDADGRFRLEENLATGQWLLLTEIPFDYETQTNYLVIVRVSDSKKATNFEVFKIDIVDVNEPPENVVLHHSEVFENQPVGTLVGILTASDPEGDHIQFRIANDPTAAFKLESVLVSSTHDAQALKTTRTLNYEEARNYLIDVSASDSTAVATVRRFQVSVKNQNEAPSAISLDVLTVDENLDLLSKVATITVSDPDAPFVSQTFQCRLLDNAGGRLGVNGFELIVLDSINYEETSQLTVYIECSDQGGLSKRSLFSIIVLDKDDPPTDVRSSTGQFRVLENLPPGSVVAVLVTTDEDSGDNFTYAVSSSNVPFGVSGSRLVTTRPLNFESRRFHVLNITSRDSSGFSVTRQIVVLVLDANDKPFSISIPSGVSVLENSPIGTLITTLGTVDDDTDQTYNYSLISKPRAVSVSSDGRMLVSDSTAIDYEASNSIHLVVQSADSGFGHLSVTKSLTVLIVDVNEAPSDVLIPVLSVTENSIAGTVVSTIQVLDPDRFPQSFTCFMKQDAGGRFQVNGGGIGSQLIQLYVGYNSSNLNYEKDKEFDILVDCVDNGGLSLAKTFTLFVINANDAPTDILFSQTILTSRQVAVQAEQTNILTTPFVSISENSTYGDIVAYIYVIDEDADQVHTCQFDNDHRVFGIHTRAREGIVIVVQGQLDYESKNQYRLQVTCTDSGRPQLNVSRAVAINVIDVKESPVAITVFPNTIMENTPSGSTVGTLDCVDLDVQTSVPVYLYSIVSLGARFAIVGSNQLVSTEPLNYEETPNISVTIEVTKVHDPPLSHQQTIIIQVVDINEPATDLFVNYNQKTVSINETAGIGSVVGELSLDDPDDNDQSSFRVVSGSNETFVTSNDDDLAVAGTLDAWSQDVYNVVIQGSDSAGHSVQTVITILVQEVDACISNNGGCDRHAQCFRAGPGLAACKCFAGFSGDGYSCFDVDECNPDPCSLQNTDPNGGGCKNGYGGVFNFSCPCRQGWGQPDCMTEANECMSSPCNPVGAEACNDLFNGYECECLPGWEGKRCEIDPDDCLTAENDPCHRHGICTDKVGGYTCNCTAPYIGVNCDTDDSICRQPEPVCPVERNATCVSYPPSNIDRYSCFCDRPFSLDCIGCADGFEENEMGSCVDVDECLPNNPCLNGGRCINTVGEFFCNCSFPWVGYKCQFDSRSESVRQSTSGSSITTVLAMAIAIAVLVVAIIIMAFLWHRHRNLRRIVYKGETAAFDAREGKVEISPQFQEMMDTVDDRGHQEFTNPTFDLVDGDDPSGLAGVILDNPVYETSSPVADNPMYEPVFDLISENHEYSNPTYTGAMSSSKTGRLWTKRPSSMARFDQS